MKITFNNSQRIASSKVFLYAFWAALFVLFYLLNTLTPLWCDDLDYANDGHTFRDIFNRETHDYLNANGRIFSHSLVQLFGGIIGKGVFNLVNTCMSLFLVFSTAKLFRPKDSHVQSNHFQELFLYSLSLLLIWFILPDQYITMFMIAGSSNYIWATVLNLLFLHYFIKSIDGHQWKKTYQIILLLALSFLSGAWMEMYSIAILPAAFFYIILKKKWKNTITLWMIVLYSVGFAIVVFAPGNFARQATTVTERPSILTWLVNQLEIAFRTKLLWVWLSIIVVLLARVLNHKYSLKTFFQETLIFQIAIIVSYAFIFVSGVTSLRAEWGICVFSFVILFIVLRNMEFPRGIYWTLSLLCIAIVFCNFLSEHKIFKQKMEAVKVMSSQLETKTLTDGDYYLWPTSRETRKSIPNPTGENGNWPGEYVAKYHHAPSFKIAPEKAYLFCNGMIDADSLFCAKVPCIESDAIIKLNTENNNQFTIKYLFQTEGFVFRSKISRLMKASGMNSISKRVYDRRSPLGKVFLEKINKEETHVISLQSSQYNSFFFDGNWHVVVPLSHLRPNYNATGTICAIE